jgi:hypothetical protein
MAQRAAAEGLINLQPELGARPRIWYRNAHRLTHHFIGGTLVRNSEGHEDCAEGMTVRLYAEDETVRDAVSDAFGDFKFESLEGKGEKYRLVALASDQGVAFEREISLSGSQWIGLIEVA